MEQLSSKQILASSSGWIAVTLNVIPGLGTGYIYQRRWKAYWLTGLVSAVWVFLGIGRQVGVDIADSGQLQTDQIGFYGFLFISLVTSFESALAVKNARVQNETS